MFFCLITVFFNTFCYTKLDFWCTRVQLSPDAPSVSMVRICGQNAFRNSQRLWFGRSLYCSAYGGGFQAVSWVNICAAVDNEKSRREVLWVLFKICYLFSRTHSSCSSYFISQEATASLTCTTSSTFGKIRLPLTSRKVNIMYMPMRLLPFKKTWLEIKEYQSRAPFSSFDG